MKNITKVLIAALLLIVLSSCSDRCDNRGELIWSTDDVEGFKIAKDNPESTLRQLSVTWQQKPPFYAGAMPIKYTSLVLDVVPPSMSMGMGGIVVVDEFEDFKTAYVYPHSMIEKLSGVPIGAVTFSKPTNAIVAEAKQTNRTSAGIEIEEVHYKNCPGGGCCVVFKSKSSIGRSGYKERESETTGRKQRDYYFIWPMGGR